MRTSGVFFASGEAPDGAVAARDARSAAWMAAGWAAVTGRRGWVAAAGDEAEIARLVAGSSRAPVGCAAPDALPRDDDGEATIPALPHREAEPAPLGAWARLDGRPIRLQRLAADLIAVLPPGAIVCVDGETLAPLVHAAAASHPSALVLSDVCAIARGAAVAWAVGAKAAAPERTVVALTDAAGFGVAAMDVPAAARAGLPVAVIVANDEPDPLPLELVAAIAGGHGEPVADPSRLSIHLRNAMTCSIPTVLNVVVAGARAGSLARS